MFSCVAEGDEDILYKPPAIVEFLGIPFGMNIVKFSGVAKEDENVFGLYRAMYGGKREFPEYMDIMRGCHIIPGPRRASLDPLLAFFGNGGNLTVFCDRHNKIIMASGYGEFTANELRQFIDMIRRKYPEIKEIKERSKPGETRLRKLSGVTTSGISVEFYRDSDPKAMDGEILYTYNLHLEYETAIGDEEDRKTKVKKKIEEDGF